MRVISGGGIASGTGRLVAACACWLVSSGPGSAQSAATIAEADGAGKVAVEIVYYAEEDCIAIADAREGAPAGIEGPQRTLVVTVTLERSPGPCAQKLRILARRISVADRADALSVDIFYVDAAGKLIRSQRPRIYRDTAEERECHAAAGPQPLATVMKC